jgi:hypothetical protein
VVWRLPIPIYDPADETHRRLVELAERAEEVATETDVDGIKTFQAKRRAIREALDRAGLASEIDRAVQSALDPATPTT